jgi:hypothetical protein
MTTLFKPVIERALARVFGLSELVRAATYFRPTSFSSSTGQVTANEVVAAVNVLLGQIPFVPLANMGLQLGDDKALVRASELSGITAPTPGDYLVETVSGQRRDVLLARLDPTGELWIFHTRPSAHEDRGDLTTATVFEDGGDLAAHTSSEDYLTLN